MLLHIAACTVPALVVGKAAYDEALTEKEASGSAPGHSTLEQLAAPTPQASIVKVAARPPPSRTTHLDDNEELEGISGEKLEVDNMEDTELEAS